jgi:hypothetical protein
MNTKNLPDYYPVYKDLSYRMNANLSDHKSESPESLSAESHIMLNAEELTDLALKYNFSSFQTVILLLKNAFEGHVFLTFEIRPEQLFSRGNLLFQPKPESMILSFYKDLVKYKPGLNQIWKILQEKMAGLGGISFDLLVHTLIVNHLIRLPVSLFSLYDIRSFSESLHTNQQAMDQQFNLVLLGESALAEHEFIQRVNFIYAEKFKEFIHQLSIKEGVFSHYQRKLALSLYPDIHTEEELDDLMYKKLVEEQVNRKYPGSEKSNPENQFNPGTLDTMLKFVNKTKTLYRSVSKNCSEVHSSTEGENSFPELNNIFLEANSIYSQPASNLSESLLQYMRMMLLLSEVVIIRKTKGYVISDNLQLIIDFNGKEVLSKEELKSLQRNMDTILASYRQKCFTDYKIKFVMDDDLTNLHNHFLQKQLDFIDQQIIQIQKDIKEILKLKSDVSIPKTEENQ